MIVAEPEEDFQNVAAKHSGKCRAPTATPSQRRGQQVFLEHLRDVPHDQGTGARHVSAPT